MFFKISDNYNVVYGIKEECVHRSRMPPFSGFIFYLFMAQPQILQFFPVGKSGGPTTLPNSLNISRNALFFRFGWSGTTLFTTDFCTFLVNF